MKEMLKGNNALMASNQYITNSWTTRSTARASMIPAFRPVVTVGAMRTAKDVSKALNSEVRTVITHAGSAPTVLTAGRRLKIPV